MNRRTFLARAAGGLVAAAPLRGLAQQSAAIVTSDRVRPRVDYGVAAGDPTPGRAMVWAHVDRPSHDGRMRHHRVVHKCTTRSGAPIARPDTGLTARITLETCRPDRTSSTACGSRSRDPRILSAPETGHLRTAPAAGRPVRIAWSADTCGQGWGIDAARGGMRLFEDMRAAGPDLFLNVGDTIYADQPLQESVKLDDGSVWRNVMTPAKSQSGGDAGRIPRQPSL